MRHFRAVVTVSAMALGLLVIALVLVRDRQRVVSQSITGELVAFEASRQDLTLRTPSGDRHFIVRGDTPIHEGANTIALADLRSASGCPAKVWYRQAQGLFIAGDIRISCAAIPRPEAPSSTQPPGP